MMEELEKIACPLSIVKRRLSGYRVFECLQERCAWWVPELKCCAVAGSFKLATLSVCKRDHAGAEDGSAGRPVLGPGGHF